MGEHCLYCGRPGVYDEFFGVTLCRREVCADAAMAEEIAWLQDIIDRKKARGAE